MKRPKSLRILIQELLQNSARALSIDEIIQELKKNYSLYKTKAQIRNALNYYDCKNILLVGREIYDLLPRVINGSYYRHTLTEQEISKGALSCDYEMHFIFDPYMKEASRKLKFSQDGNPIAESGILFCGPMALPRRQIRGFDNWFRTQDLTPDDDLIIKIIDIESGIYEITPQRKKSRDEILIEKKNKEIADLAEKIIERINTKGAWPEDITKRIMSMYSYKDKCPPDQITRIAEKDKRFFMYTEKMDEEPCGHFKEIYLADKVVKSRYGAPAPKNWVEFSEDDSAAIAELLKTAKKGNA